MKTQLSSNKSTKKSSTSKNSFEKEIIKLITTEINNTHPDIIAAFQSMFSALPHISIKYPNTYKTTQITISTKNGGEILLRHHIEPMTNESNSPYLELRIPLEDPTFLQQIHNTIKTIRTRK